MFGFPGDEGGKPVATLRKEACAEEGRGIWLNDIRCE